MEVYTSRPRKGKAKLRLNVDGSGKWSVAHSTAPRATTVVGSDLTIQDYAELEARWIDRTLAILAGFRRVDSITGAEIVGRKGGNYSGLLRDMNIPVVITEGEFKTLALWRLANHGSPDGPGFCRWAYPASTTGAEQSAKRSGPTAAGWT